MPRTLVPGASTMGVTAQDVDDARRERDRLADEHEAALEAAHASLAEMRGEDGRLPQTAETRGQVEELFAAADQLGLQVDEARDHVERLHRQAFGADRDDRMDAETARRRGHSAGTVGSASLASRLFANEEFRQVLAQARGSANPAAVIARELGTIDLASDAETAMLLSAASARRGGVELAAQFDGDPMVPDDSGRVPNPFGLPTRDPAILDLITISTTGLDLVEYTVQLDEAGNVVGALPGADLGEASINIERRSVPVVDRGTTLPVPERNLEDEGRVRSFLEGRLTGFLRRDAEDNVIAGDGTGESFTGIENWTGVGGSARLAGDNVADGIHRGITQVRMNYFAEPDAVAFGADTWESIVLEKDDQGRYVHSAGALSQIPTSVWGKRGVVAHAIDADKAIVGAWNEAEMVVRIGLQLREFEQHADYARKRLVLIRALYRAAFLINQPTAFSVVDLTEPA